MAYPTTPYHGKWGLVYWLRPNGFKGTGLNDVTWGTACSNAASRDYLAEIDANGTADTFRWSVDGGSSWEAEDVVITGAAQTLDNGQTITFAATTGHTIGDRFHIGNARVEPTSESGSTAQVTEATHRLLKPDKVVPGDWTDSNSMKVDSIDYTSGKAYFAGAVGTVTLTRNDGYVLEAELDELGYTQGWSLSVAVDMADASYQGADWKYSLPGQAGATGSIDKLYIPNESLFEQFTRNADGTQNYFLLQLFIKEDATNRDQTGDHIFVWVTITNFGVSTSNNDAVKSNISFQVYGHVPVVTAAT